MSPASERPDEALFQEAMADLGGKLDLARLRPHIAQPYADYSRRAEAIIATTKLAYPRLAPVYFGIVDNSALQAWAFALAGRGFIAIHVGTYIVLQSLFDRMLADPAVLPWIGDPTAEIPNLPKLPGLDFDARGKRFPDASRVLAPGWQHAVPRDPVRREYANRLTSQALDFLAGHELMHILNGHVGLLNSLNPAALMPEFGFNPHSTSEALDRQTMEWDADTSSASIWLSSLRRTVAPLSDPPLDPEGAPFKAALESAFIWSFAINSFFRLYGDHAPVTALTAGSHPPWRVRQHMVMQAGERYIQTRWDPGLTRRFGETIGSAVAAVETVFPLITGEPLAIAGLSGDAYQHSEAYFHQLRDHWISSLRPRLVPFATGHLIS